MEKLLMRKSRLKAGKTDKALESREDSKKKNVNEKETLMTSIPDIPGVSNDENPSKENLTMKEYEEHLKKLQAENFNLKLKMYLVEERLSKVSGINDKEQQIKKNIQLKVTQESQQKELDHKQELLFEASKAFEQLQKEHETEASEMVNLKEREISKLKSEIAALEENLNQMTNCFNIKCVKNYERRISSLEKKVQAQKNHCQESANTIETTIQQMEPYKRKVEGLENELKERIGKMEKLVEELEVKERDLAASNFKLRKLEEELTTKKREDGIIKERLSEKNQMIESIQNCLTDRGVSIDTLEKRLGNEKSATQTILSKLDTANFLNITLKEELETLQSRLHRNTSLTNLTFTPEEENYRAKFEELQKSLDEKEVIHKERVMELERQIFEKCSSGNGAKQLGLKYKKLEEDHRKACAALKTFVKRTGEEQKQRETLNKRLRNQKETMTVLKSHLEKISSNAIAVPRIQKGDEKLWPLVGSLFKPLSNK